MQLREDQKRALAALSDRSIYVAPPGAGKTPVSSVWLSTGAGPALVVCPANVRMHWFHVLEAWTDQTVVPGWGTPAYRERARKAAKLCSGVLVINYESFRQDIDKLRGFNQVVFDEAHRLKSRDALVHKAAVKLARRTPRALFVTGTPVLNRADELWSYLHMLDPKQYPSFWRWARQHFAIEQTTFYGHLPTPVAIVHDLLPNHAELVRDEVAEFLVEGPGPDLPEVVETVLEVELTGRERAAYDSMVRKSWMKVEGELTHAVNEVAKITRLRQLVSQWDTATESSSKVKAAVELAGDLEPEPVVILTAYRASADRIAAALNCPVVHGGVDAQVREVRLKGFGAGNDRCIVGTIDAIGEGTDGLQRAHHLILVDRSWTPARNEQALGRIRRSGQTASGLYAWHIVAGDTVDQKVAEALIKKESIIHALRGPQ